MNTILEENREAVRAVGRRLMEIGAVLAEGKMDEVRTRAATARRTYRAWEELDPKQAHNQSANGQVARIKFEA